MRQLIAQVFQRQISLRQAVLAVWHFISPSRMLSGDDFNWSNYHKHYKEELNSISRSSTLLLDAAEIKFSRDSLIVKCEPQMLPTHHALYETILRIAPASVTEVGAGGGDHLHNVTVLFKSVGLPTILVSGIDRSPQQLELLRSRHPLLTASLEVTDASSAHAKIPVADVVYSHAVLMHISEKNNRFQIALRNMISAAGVAVVMQENWTQHDFLSAAFEEIKRSSKPGWRVYRSESSMFKGVKTMVLAAPGLPFQVVEDYSEFLEGSQIRSH